MTKLIQTDKDSPHPNRLRFRENGIVNGYILQQLFFLNSQFQKFNNFGILFVYILQQFFFINLTVF